MIERYIPRVVKNLIGEIKIKHLGSAVGVIDAVVYGGFCGRYFIERFIQDEHPVQKVVDGVIILVAGLAGADGVVDIFRGTHHYLGLITLRRFARSEKRRNLLDADIALLLSRREGLVFPQFKTF